MNRALKFVADSYGGVIPEMDITGEEKNLFAQITALLQAYINTLEQVRCQFTQQMEYTRAKWTLYIGYLAKAKGEHNS